MANNYFKFKEFTVWQNQTVMKVCTDSCLFGAWASRYLPALKTEDRILDIGTGTGLLSLMLAQQYPTQKIDALEINEDAANEASNNFQQSPWANRLSVVGVDVTMMQPPITYDIIICNPPFYETSLQSTNQAKNQAHHSTTLTCKALFTAINRFCNEKAFVAILIPFNRKKEIELMAKQMGWHKIREAIVQQTKRHTPFRSMFIFTNQTIEDAGQFPEDIYVIKPDGQAYSEDFINLLRPYYLYL